MGYLMYANNVDMHPMVKAERSFRITEFFSGHIVKFVTRHDAVDKELRVFGGTGLELVASRPRPDTLTTRLRRPPTMSLKVCTMNSGPPCVLSCP
ncbi:hypothetical protein TNCV_4286511 [Trichonephila clavipes]|nr:hypothetical protein TNCV_4286511 [Trichonephila clavipes]